MPTRPAPHARSAASLPRIAVLVLVPLLATGRCEAGAMDTLAGLDLPRSGAARLTVPVRYRPCADPPQEMPSLSRCGERPALPRGARPTVNRLEAAGRTANPDTLHARIVVGLLWPTSGESSGRESISSLQRLARIAADSVAVFVDLSAAYLERAERRDTPRDLMEAAEAAERALARDPGNASARFNLALALDRFGLVDAAIQAWTGFLEVEPASGWAAEARRRVGVLQEMGKPVARPRRTAPAAEAEAFATRAPQEARLLAWDELLGEWGEAVERGDSLTAAQRLAQAEAIGRGLARRGGDATTANAVGAIRARGRGRAAMLSLARAHRDFARARAAYDRNDRAGAYTLFARVLGQPGPSAPLRDWARVFAGAGRAYDRDYPGAERLLHEATGRADTLRAPALAARARWHLASTRFFQGHYRDALELYLGAERLFRRAGETDHLGAVQGYAANTAFQLGDHTAGYEILHRAALDLRRSPASRWRHTTLWIAADAAIGLGMPRAGARVADEVIAVDGRMPGLPEYGAEGHALRARARAAAGDQTGAAADAADARNALKGVTAAGIREMLIGDVNLSEALAALADGRVPPRETLDEAVSRLGSRVSRLAPALIARAEASLARHDTAAAAADIDTVIRLFEEQRDSLTASPLRASITEAARGVFDRMVMLRLRSGQPERALAYLERGRLAFTLRPGGPSPVAGLPAWPRGETALDMALIGDTLVTWVIDGDSVRAELSRVDRDALLRTAEGVRLALEQGAPEAAVRPGLERLYETIIRPVQGRLGARERPLVLVADGELAGIPFAALRDRRHGSYLVEEHPLRWAATLRDGARPRIAPDGPLHAFVVGDPAYLPAEHPGLEPLREATAEARAVAGLYPGASLVSDTAARRDALVAGLRSASMVHYAGHAVFDDERPERSYLVLAGHASELTAGGVDTLDLRGLRLVVLSACETLRSREGRTGGFAGLSGAFLHAGARGVLGSLWLVNDRGVRPLMVRFHREYLRTGDAARALRAAQTALLQSPDPALRTPALWAAFRYGGD